MLHENVFTSTKKVNVAQKSISCQQKQDEAAQKICFVLKKVNNSFPNSAPCESVSEEPIAVKKKTLIILHTKLFKNRK